MFENMTYEVILQRMLDRIPETMDKREGAIIYDALASAAVEMQNLFLELDMVMNECFADTASLEYLIRRAEERGLKQKPATSAVLKAVSTPTTVEIGIGSRFSLNTLNYAVIEKVADGEYKVQCETPGVEANSYFGSMIPIDYVDGLETIEATELLIPGEDEEDVESLRERYYETMESQGYGGNIADYKTKTLKIPGVGGVKVTPVWNGGGTVKVTFIDSTYCVPSNELIETVQATLDPIGHQGEGYGVAPIGHVVTVEAAEGVAVNIDSEITYADGWSWEDCGSQICKIVDDFFAELSKEWDASNDTILIVRISQLESNILKCDGVLDVAGTTLNGSAANVHLDKYQIPIRGLINGK